ncbi:MAG: CoB--CoM heterodisulfide reductase iron-sulfur subunit A family protein [Actinobacteria bacterium]|nr:CoB--CoM heterodisulfide reductase iron-sulfur subunit A family protein [Actinomycetota bacterium]MBU1494514.1 CoB--CoM heterodisulfide reductase iron-sulfur subunit A family protein [Actinomycetota bacterium]
MSGPSLNGDTRIGVYVCHCGTNIAGPIDVEAVTEYAAGLPGVVVARAYKYMCSDPGQELITHDILEEGLDRVVVASCSPSLHEETFRRAVAKGGVNPYLFQMVNIREHGSWVHDDVEMATAKAKDLVRAGVARVRFHRPLEPRRVPVDGSAMVVGGGIAGIHAALTLANAGKHVYLVEREPTIGGHMAQFDKTFPTLDCAACILTPKMTQVRNHPNITLWTMAEVVEVDGFVGAYRVKVRHEPRFIIEDACVGCLECIDVCVFRNGKTPDEFNLGLSKRKPIYIPFPQAVPQVVVIDPEACIEFRAGCRKKTCVEVCADRNAIDFQQVATFDEVEVGTIVLATGFKTFDAGRIPYYGYGRYDNVYTALEVERLVNAAGPTTGEVVLRDGRTPQSVGIIHCVGSRDENTNTHCSRVCCMYSLKLAHLMKEKTGAEVYNFYIDMRTPGKGMEEFYNRVGSEGVHFIRGKVGDVYPEAGDTGRLVLQAEDTLLGRIRKIPVDMVVLATGIEPQSDAEDVRRLFNITCSAGGFFMERHPKLAPVSTFTDGVFLAGTCQGPRDIPDTVAQAGAAAAEALALIDAGSILLEPNTAFVSAEDCSGCKTCIGMCPYQAIAHIDGKAVINEVLCKGCGTCVAACPSGAIHQNLFDDDEIFEEILGVLIHA